MGIPPETPCSPTTPLNSPGSEPEGRRNDGKTRRDPRGDWRDSIFYVKRLDPCRSLLFTPT